MSNPLQLSLATFKKGAYIIVEGKQNADYFYIIRSGKVRISKEAEVVEEEESPILEPGDFFGVVSTMSNHSHIETAQALTDVSMISVHREQYSILIERNTPVAMKIIQGFSKKVRYLDEALTKLTFANSAHIDENHLFDVGEYYLRQSRYNHAFYALYQYLKYCPGGHNIPKAKEYLAKIKPYSKAVFLDGSNEEFNRTYPKDTMVFSEGQPGHELYILQKGQVKISKIVNDKEVMLALLKPGDIFGEMSLLENKPRSASAMAHENAVLLAVNRSNFERMVTSQPQIIARLTTLLAERIWFLYKQLANIYVENPVGRLYDALVIQLEKNRVPIRQGSSYSFSFGPKDLLNMVGIGTTEGNGYVKELLGNPSLRLVDNKIYSTDLLEIEKQAKYFRKMTKISQNRQAGQTGLNPSRM